MVFNAADLIEATRLTKAGRLAEATGMLRGMLSGQPGGRVGAGGAVKARLGDILGRALPGNVAVPGSGLASPAAVAADTPKGAQFLDLTFSNQAGTRPYRLYVPSRYAGKPVPLIVMLHGCTQSPEDFAAGTGMNEAAEDRVCIVAYPGQSSSANMQKCWNWFKEQDQHRGQGEPALIAGMTREIMSRYAIDPRRVYVAGLSAGGAAAAIMGQAYPELYAAIGVHSGLACGAARDVSSAFAAMQRGPHGAPGFGAAGRPVPAIVFHGDHDTTVHPANADAVAAQSMHETKLVARVETGEAGGLTYRRILHEDAQGAALIEQWVVHGAGHAWSGGSRSGSYTDPRGPDATGEMLRFFLDHPKPA